VGYYLRAFCSSEELPPLRRVHEWAATRGVALELEDTSAPLDADVWRKARIRYKPGKQPLVIDVLRASSDRTLSEEVEEFVELLEDLGDSADARKVLAHLRDCEAIVTVQLLSDINDDGYKAVDVFLRFFVDHCGAIIQADGEGFYERDRLLVELP